MTATALRLLLAAALLTSAGVHLERWFAGYRSLISVIGGQQYHIIGPLFLVNTVAGVVLAIAVLALSHWLPLLAAAGFGAGTLAAFIAYSTVGLFGPPAPLVWNAPELTAALAEALCVVFVTVLLIQRRRSEEAV